MDDYQLLGLGSAASMITGVRLDHWGYELTFECEYGAGSQPYSLVFYNCRETRWYNDDDPFDDEPWDLDLLNLLRIELGEGNHQKPAVVRTEIFEVHILYEKFEVNLKQRN